jgi:heme A synthase
MTVSRFAWATIVWNVVVIVMGAVVRATGSGAGCGRSWPGCQGTVVPALEGATAVEFAHRAASGVGLALVAVLVVWVFRAVPRGHQGRTAAVLSLVAIVGEALIGAAIVLFEWVADDASLARVVSVPLHLVNTFLLLGALTLTAHLVGGGTPLDPARHRPTLRWLVGGAVALLLIAGSGSVTALADTLFPKGASVTAEHVLTDLRMVHPILAVVVAGGAWIGVSRRGSIRREAGVMAALVGIQMASGALVIALGLPLWLRLAHLLLADLLWIAYVLVAARLLAGVEAPVSASGAEQVP